MDREKRINDYICHECGIEFLSEKQMTETTIATAHISKCGLCGEDKSIIHMRHYNYLYKHKTMKNTANEDTVGTGNPTMTMYLGTKKLLARPMNLLAYNKYRGWKLPEDENPEEVGYLVEYTSDGKPNHTAHKGYISWSPKGAFEGAYRKNGALTYGHAITALKEGKMVQRAGWNGAGMFVFMQVPATVPAAIVPKMSSLPEEVKEALTLRGGDLQYSNQFALVKEDNTINGWVASSADTLAEDWCTL